LPERWVITDDGSSDRTAEIIAEFGKSHPWLTLVRNPNARADNFAAKAEAVNTALAQLNNVEFDVLGNLDADVTFAPDYMEFLMRKFSADPKLGVAGTPFTSGRRLRFHEGQFRERKFCSRADPAFSPRLFPRNRRLHRESRRPAWTGLP